MIGLEDRQRMLALIDWMAASKKIRSRPARPLGLLAYHCVVGSIHTSNEP